MLDQAIVNLRPELQSGPLRSPSELRFRSLLERLPAGAYTCDSDGLITYFNQHAVQLWGRSPRLNDPIDRFCGSFKLFAMDGSPISHDQCWMAQALKNVRDYNGHEIMIETPAGERRTALAYASPISDEAGRLLGAVNVLVDISDRKLAELALKEADRSKNEFLATLAHELRNPLAPIRAAVKILRLKGDFTDDSKTALEVIERQTGQMARLIDDLLDIARITSNKLELRTARIELSEVINAAVETSRPLIAKRDHELIVKTPSEPVYLNGDLVRLAQLLSNLLNNAAKYTEPGGRIWLAAAVKDKKVTIKVRDTGIGISAAALPQIFEMFTQGNRATGAGGLGIGLTLVKRLVEMHGGSITVRSDGPGRGSEFKVRLPLAEKKIETPQTLGGTEDKSNAEKPAPLSILVVDDNQDSADSLGLLLELMGNEVRIAHDGIKAIEIATEFKPRVILLDIGLPSIDGYEVARKIRAHPEAWARDALLIAVTGWGDDSDRQLSKEAGFDHHLVKPLDPEALTKLLRLR